MEARPIAAAALLAFAVAATTAHRLLHFPEPPRSVRLIGQFPVLASTGSTTIASFPATIRTTARARTLSLRRTTLVPGEEERFIPDPYLLRTDDDPAGDSYGGALNQLRAAQFALAEAREREAGGPPFAPSGDPVAAQRSVEQLEAEVLALETAAANEKRKRPRPEAPLVQRASLLVLLRDGACRTQDGRCEEEVEQLLERNRLQVRSGIPEISLLFVVSTDPASATNDGEAARLHALVARLEESDLVQAAAQNLLLGSDFLPQQFPTVSRDWYTSDALSLSSFPQAWNFRSAMTRVDVGVLDRGFLKRKDIDVGRLNTAPCTDTSVDNHGTYMAGVIGATFDNAIDTDGGAPLVNLVGCAVKPPVTCDREGLSGLQQQLCLKKAAFSEFIEGLRLLLKHARIVNASLSYQWVDLTAVTTNDADLRKIVSAQGTIVRDLMVANSDAILVSSSGNDRGAPAAWASPFNWAALEAASPAPNIIVADAVCPDGVPLSRSNLGGSIKVIAHSIPAAFTPTTAATKVFDFASDTSGAAAMVTAVVAMIRSIEPTLRPAAVKMRLGIVGTTVPTLQAYCAVSSCFAKPKVVLADMNGQNGITGDDFVLLKREYQFAKSRALPDVNGDGFRNQCDAKFLRGDLNDDGCIDKDDLEILLAEWKNLTEQEKGFYRDNFEH